MAADDEMPVGSPAESPVETVPTPPDRDTDVRDALPSDLDFATPIGTRVTFRNPPNGENLTPRATVIRVTGRGEYEVV